MKDIARELLAVAGDLVADVGDVKVIEPVGEGVSKTKQTKRMGEPVQSSVRVVAGQMEAIAAGYAEQVVKALRRDMGPGFEVELSASAKKIAWTLVRILGTYRMGRDSANYGRLKKYLPREEPMQEWKDWWYDLTDARQYTVVKKAIRKVTGIKAFSGLDRIAARRLAGFKKWDSRFMNRNSAEAIGSRRADAYLAFHELSRREQSHARRAYPHKSVGAKYDFVDEHYYYPVKKDGSLAKGHRVLAIPHRKLIDEAYMKSLGYSISPKWES